MTATPEDGDLGGRYDLRELVGEGGFARVYRAVDRESGRSVAVKFPNHEGSSNDPEVIEEYFLKEVEALERRRDKARQIKQGMMQELLTGRTRLVEPTPEAAEEMPV